MKKYSVKMPVTAVVVMEYTTIIEATDPNELQGKIVELEMVNAKDLQSRGHLMLPKPLVIDEVQAVHVLDANFGEVQSTQTFGYPC